MKKINSLLGIVIGLTMLACSSDEIIENNDNNNTEKKLTQITYQHLNNQSEFTQNIVYDTNDNIIEITNNNGSVLSSFVYNSNNLLIQKEFSEYDNQLEYFKETDHISYNNDNKISHIEHIGTIYNADGSVSNQSTTNHTITYGNNSMTRISDDFANTKTEYTLTNNLITGIKVYKSNTLKSNMLFVYNAEGNCVSGSGPINEGSLDATTSNIELNVTYTAEEKKPVFNAFFDFDILKYTSFYNLRQVLVNQQGNNYPKDIQWYQYRDYVFKETNSNLFDSDGYIISKTLSEVPDYPNYGMLTYTWE